MTEQLHYHDPDADIAFTWDGGKYIKISTIGGGANGTNPGWGVVPDRFYVGEPDLWQTDLLPENERPKFPRGTGVVMLDRTQEAFEAACNAWWRDRPIKTARDFRVHPLLFKAKPGMFVCAMDFRYTGGDTIDASPAGLNHWRPIVDLAHDDMTPEQVTAPWLYGRIEGWQIGFMEHHGIIGTQPTDPHRYGWNANAEKYEWIFNTFPREIANDCAAGVWRDWLTRRIADGFRHGDVDAWRNAGIAVHRVNDRHPWTTLRTAADGRRWNFVWIGSPCAYVYSPDTDRPHRNTLHACTWLARPTDSGDLSDLADGDVRTWLEQQADAFIARLDTDTRPELPVSPEDLRVGDTVLDAGIIGRTIASMKNNRIGRLVTYCDATWEERATGGRLFRWGDTVLIKRGTITDPA